MLTIMQHYINYNSNIATFILPLVILAVQSNQLDTSRYQQTAQPAAKAGMCIGFYNICPKSHPISHEDAITYFLESPCSRVLRLRSTTSDIKNNPEQGSNEQTETVKVCRGLRRWYTVSNCEKCVQKYRNNDVGDYTWPHPKHGIAPHILHKVLSRYAFDCFQTHTISILTETEGSRWITQQANSRISAWLEELYGDRVTDPSGLSTIGPRELEDGFTSWDDGTNPGSRLSMTYISSSDLEGCFDSFDS